MAYLLYSYKHFLTLETVNLANNHIGNYGGYILCNVVMNFSRELINLNLRNTLIGIETVKAIRDLLTSTNCHLKTLVISKNNISDIYFCELCVGIS
jgi:hypothetical protein